MRGMTARGELRPEQVGAARYILGWSQTDLAEAAGLGRATIVAFENSTREPYTSVRTAIRDALERAGIKFIFGRNGSYGVVFIGIGKPRASDSKSA